MGTIDYSKWDTLDTESEDEDVGEDDEVGGVGFSGDDGDGKEEEEEEAAGRGAASLEDALAGVRVDSVEQARQVVKAMGVGEEDNEAGAGLAERLVRAGGGGGATAKACALVAVALCRVLFRARMLGMRSGEAKFRPGGTHGLSEGWMLRVARVHTAGLRLAARCERDATPSRVRAAAAFLQDALDGGRADWGAEFDAAPPPLLHPELEGEICAELGDCFCQLKRPRECWEWHQRNVDGLEAMAETDPTPARRAAVRRARAALGGCLNSLEVMPELAAAVALDPREVGPGEAPDEAALRAITQGFAIAVKGWRGLFKTPEEARCELEGARQLLANGLDWTTAELLKDRGARVGDAEKFFVLKVLAMHANGLLGMARVVCMDGNQEELRRTVQNLGTVVDDFEARFRREERDRNLIDALKAAKARCLCVLADRFGDTACGEEAVGLKHEIFRGRVQPTKCAMCNGSVDLAHVHAHVRGCLHVFHQACAESAAQDAAEEEIPCPLCRSDPECRVMETFARRGLPQRPRQGA